MWVFHHKHMGTMCKMSNYIHKMLLNTRGTASIVFLVTNRISNLPSIDEELACFEVWVCRSGDFAILQISSERTDESTVFFPEINHSPTRTGTSTTSQFRLWKHLSICPRQFNVSPASTKSGQDGRRLSNWGRLGSVRIGCSGSPGPGLTLHARQRGTGFEVGCFWPFSPASRWKWCIFGFLLCWILTIESELIIRIVFNYSFQWSTI